MFLCSISIPFYTNVPTGSTLMLVGGNSDWAFENVSASGQVDFE